MTAWMPVRSDSSFDNKNFFVSETDDVKIHQHRWYYLSYSGGP